MRHLSLPLRLSSSGALAAHTVGTPAEVGQSVGLLLATRIGERRSEPAYGTTDPLFGPRPALRLDVAAVTRWEPRATDDLVELAAAAS